MEKVCSKIFGRSITAMRKVLFEVIKLSVEPLLTRDVMLP